VTARPGAASVAELVLAAWLFALVLAGIARFATDQNRLASLQRDRTRFEEAVRTASIVLGAELRFLAPGDVTAVAADSIRLRAFRGGGRLCHAEDESIWIVYRGVRRPDPAKDSVLLAGSGEPQVLGVVSSHDASACGGSMRVVLAESPAPEVAYALLFETGTYALTDGAVRYRRGEGGRQPLTEPLLEVMAFESGPAGLRIRLGGHPDSLSRLTPRMRAFGVGTLNGSPFP
jgi:hypothetical protein